MSSRDDALTDLVNPFIGTENEGNTYPGAAVPFGMVQLSPDTGHNTGYDHSHNHIRGFSSVHLSGVGCGLGGDRRSAGGSLGGGRRSARSLGA